MDELILRVNNERNYPLPLAYYNVTEIGDEWEWLHEWGFELSVELLKELCDADHVCDSWESNYIWQTNAQLVYSLAFYTDKYYNDFIDYFNYCEEYRKQKEEEKKREMEETELKKRKEEEKKREKEETELKKRKGEEKEGKENAGYLAIIFSFLFPIIGLILYFTKKDDVKKTEAYLIAAGISYAIRIIIVIAGNL